MRLGLSLSLTQSSPRSSGGGGGEPYVAQAVQFDGENTMLSIAELIAGAASPYLTVSFWIKAPAQEPVPPFEFIDRNIFVLDQDNNYINNISIVSDDGVMAPFFFDDTRTYGFSWHTGTTPLDAWINIKMAVDTGKPAGQKICQVYVGNSSTPSGAVNADNDQAFDMLFAGYNFNVGADGYGNGVVGDMADFWLAPGVFIDFSVEANRRKFIDADGKPVDLGNDGSAPTGTSPMIFFKREGAAATFATNRGTGGAFTLTGSLNAASTSPSD